jgi:hypothetical protein
MSELVEFTVAGAPGAVARTIEACAEGQGSLTALVVPWESGGTTLSMAVTSVAIDGWAIEHTNLGTITLSGLDGNCTRVSCAADRPDHPERQKLAALFHRFVGQVRDSLGARAS